MADQEKGGLDLAVNSTAKEGESIDMSAQELRAVSGGVTHGAPISFNPPSKPPTGVINPITVVNPPKTS